PDVDLVHRSAVLADDVEKGLQRRSYGALVEGGVEDDHDFVWTHGNLITSYGRVRPRSCPWQEGRLRRQPTQATGRWLSPRNPRPPRGCAGPVSGGEPDAAGAPASWAARRRPGRTPRPPDRPPVRPSAPSRPRAGRSGGPPARTAPAPRRHAAAPWR